MNGSNRAYDATRVQSIRFEGNDGNDRFVNDTTLPSIAYGGNGNDTLTGGRNHDELIGGRGQDTLSGRRGNDWLWGGSEQDSVSGGLGDNFVFQDESLIAVLSEDQLELQIRGSNDTAVYRFHDDQGWNAKESMNPDGSVTTRFESNGWTVLQSGTFLGEMPMGFQSVVESTVSSSGQVTLNTAWNLNDVVADMSKELEEAYGVRVAGANFGAGLASGAEIKELLDWSDPTGFTTPVRDDQPYFYRMTQMPTGHIGNLSASLMDVGNHVVILDPTDPYIYVKIPDPTQTVGDFAAGVSANGKIPYYSNTDLDRWEGEINGHVYFEVDGIDIDLLELEVDGAITLDLDANDDGIPAIDLNGIMAQNAPVAGSLPVGHDFEFGVNGRLNFSPDFMELVSVTIPLGSASLVVDQHVTGYGETEVHLAGAAIDPLEGTFLEGFVPEVADFDLQASVYHDGDFYFDIVASTNAGWTASNFEFHADRSQASIRGSKRLFGTEVELSGTVYHSGYYSLRGRANIGFGDVEIAEANLHLTPHGLTVTAKDQVANTLQNVVAPQIRDWADGAQAALNDANRGLDHAKRALDTAERDLDKIARQAGNEVRAFQNTLSTLQNDLNTARRDADAHLRNYRAKEAEINRINALPWWEAGQKLRLPGLALEKEASLVAYNTANTAISIATAALEDFKSAAGWVAKGIESSPDWIRQSGVVRDLKGALSDAQRVVNDINRAQHKALNAVAWEIQNAGRKMTTVSEVRLEVNFSDPSLIEENLLNVPEIVVSVSYQHQGRNQGLQFRVPPTSLNVEEIAGRIVNHIT